MKILLALRWMLVALIIFALSGFVAFTALQNESNARHKLAVESCRLVGEDRRAMYRILISLAYIQEIPVEARTELQKQASDVFRTLDCSDVDRGLLDVPRVKEP